MNAKILSETLLHSTILIECTDGVHISCGTGFFFLFSTKDPKHKIPVIRITLRKFFSHLGG